MSQLTLAVLIGVAGWLAWKGFGVKRAPVKRPAPPRPVELERDPETGVYRPMEREER